MLILIIATGLVPLYFPYRDAEDRPFEIIDIATTIYKL